MGKEVAMAPSESDFTAAARWSIHLPEVKSAAVSDVLLRIAYQGDVARIYAGNRLFTDDFYHGAPWEIGLRNIPASALRQGLELKILPLRQDAPIYLAAGARPASFPGRQTARLIRVEAVPVYHAEANLER
jgi:beta-galactosidase